MPMIREIPFVVLLVLALPAFVASLCKNNTEIRYNLNRPVHITHYYGVCSQYTGRTCCSTRNVAALAKKVKKAVDSPTMSTTCKNEISRVLCSLCDGDWGEGVYEGVCGNHCLGLYESCKRDYFLLDSMNNKLRACKDTDLFCWKLSDLIEGHHKIQVNDPKQTYKICQHFDIISSNQASPCWSGQISAQTKGNAKKEISFHRANKTASKSFYSGHEKEMLYGGVILILLGALVYKLLAPKRQPRYYYRLD